MAPLTALAAEQGQSIGLEEIVVTARKVTESLQETPVAVTALRGDELESRGMKNLMDIGGTVPNLTLTAGAANAGSSNSSIIYIRGVGQTDFLATTDPGVAIYVDGVYFSRSVGSVMDLLDLERLEVLRGPQGTLFGKNTIGGVINLVSSRPSDELGGYVEATVGEYNRTDFKGVVDVPLVDNVLNSRFAVSYKKQDGYMDVREWDFATMSPGRVVDEQGDQDRVSTRATFDWQMADDLNANFVVDYSRSREKPAPVKLLQYTGGPKPVPALGDLWNGLVGFPSGTPMTTAFISDDEDTTYSIQNAPNDLDQGGAALTVEKSFASMTLKSITSYREFDAEFGRDAGLPINWQSTHNKQEQHQISQEFNLSGSSFDERLTWTTGVYYITEENIDRNQIMVVEGLYTVLESLPGQLPNPVNTSCSAPWIAPGCPGNPININLDIDLDAYNKIESESYGVFFQSSYALTDQLGLTLGMRYSQDKKDYTLEHKRVVSNTFSVPLTKIGDDWGAFTPMASVDYQLNEQVMLYTSFSRGYKSGGFNGRPLGENEVQSFDPEYVDSLEIGLKSEWWDNRLRLNMAAFFSQYDDMQFSANVFSPATGSLQLIIDNVGKADIQGFEVELEARPVAALSIRASLGYTDFEIKELTAEVPGVSENSDQPFTPEWTGSLSVAYDWVVGAGNLNARLDWTYQTDSYADIQNTAVLVHDESSLFNSRITYTTPAEDWEFSVWGLNLTDERYVATGIHTLDSFGHAEGTYNPPRQFGATVKKIFH